MTRTTHKEFAARLGWNPNVLSRFLGGRDLTGDHLADLLRYLLGVEE